MWIVQLMAAMALIIGIAGLLVTLRSIDRGGIMFKDIPGRFRAQQTGYQLCDRCALNDYRCFKHPEIRCTPGTKVHGMQLESHIIYIEVTNDAKKA